MAIDAVTDAIMDLIKDSMGNQPGLTPNQIAVNFSSPDESAANAHLILFLYLITPEPELRNAERLRSYPNPGDPPALFAPAVPLELRFLVTTGPGAPSGSKALARLAAAIRVIESSSPLSVPAAHQEAVWLSLLPLTSDEMARIWGLFPNENCRSSFAFRASPVWIEPRDPVTAAPQITDDRFHSGPLQGGRA